MSLSPILYSGNTAWSAPSRRLLVWNLVNGLDMYQVSNGITLARTFVVRIRRNHVKQVDFAQNDSLAVCGGDRGEVYIWEISSGKQFQVLLHGSGQFRKLHLFSPGS